MINKKREGAALIGIVITLVILGILTAAFISLNSSSSIAPIFANLYKKAYYLAESGGRYSVPKILSGANRTTRKDIAVGTDGLNGKTVVMSDGGKFELAITAAADDQPELYTIVATGVVNEGSWLESRAKIRYNVVPPAPSGDSIDEFFDDGTLDSLTIHSGRGWGEFEIVDDEGDNALWVADTAPAGGRDPQAYAGYNKPDFCQAWIDQGYILSYDVQVKIKQEPVVESPENPYYMAGINTRVSSGIGGGAMTTYGFSFIRAAGDFSHGNDEDGIQIDDWVSSLNDKPAIIMWKYNQGAAANKKDLLAYRALDADALGIIEDDGVTLKPWTTMLVRVQEMEDPSDPTQRYNQFRIYVANDGPDNPVSSGLGSIDDDVRMDSPRNGLTNAANERYLPWPPYHAENVTSVTDDEDRFTLVEGWTAVSGTEITVVNYGSAMPGAVLKTDAEPVPWTTPDGPTDPPCSFFDTQPEVGLHAIGKSYYGTFFDDLSVKFPVTGGGGSGGGSVIQY